MLNSNISGVSGLQIQYGSITLTAASSGSYSDTSVTFSESFSNTPYIVMSISNNTTNTNYPSLAFTTIERSTTGFTIRMINSSSGSPTPTIHWIAIR